MVEEGFGLFGAGSIYERRPSALAGIAIQSELGDSQDRTANIVEGEVHFAFIIFKEADAGDFLGEPVGLSFRVGVSDADEDNKTAPNLAGDLAVGGDTGLADTLEECFHNCQLSIVN